jgi:hypothetical protein
MRTRAPVTPPQPARADAKRVDLIRAVCAWLMGKGYQPVVRGNTITAKRPTSKRRKATDEG